MAEEIVKQAMPFGLGFTTGYMVRRVGQLIFLGGTVGFGVYQIGIKQGFCSPLNKTHIDTATAVLDLNQDGKVDISDFWGWIDVGANKTGISVPEGSKSGPFLVGFLIGVSGFVVS